MPSRSEVGRTWVFSFKGLLIAAVAALVAAGGAANADTDRTGNLGLRFIQDGARLRMHETNQGQYRVYEITLRPSAFEITAPLTTWSAQAPDAPMEIAVSEDRNLLRFLRLGRTTQETEFIGTSFYKTMAYDPEAIGEILTAETRIWDNRPDIDYGNNGIAEHRYSDVRPDEHRFVVTAIRARDRFSSPALRDVMRSGNELTVVIYLDRRLGTPPDAPSTLEPGEMEDVVDAREVDIVRLRFQ